MEGGVEGGGVERSRVEGERIEEGVKLRDW